MISESQAKKYCKDYTRIENYEKAMADSKMWDCHHRLEIAPFSGKTISRKKLIEYGMYYDVQPEALIFLTKTEHMRLHMRGKPISEEQKRKISETLKGKPAWNKGKLHTEETKRHMSESHKGKPAWNKGKRHTEETKKKLSEAIRGRHWFNNGTISVRAFECPEGFVPGRLNY